MLWLAVWLMWAAGGGKAVILASSKGLADVAGIRLVVVVRKPLHFLTLGLGREAERGWQGLRAADNRPFPEPRTPAGWVEAPGERNITEFGADQAFELGVAFRARYADLLKDINSRNLVSCWPSRWEGEGEDEGGWVRWER